MDSQTKRTVLAMLLCLVILVGWLKVQQVLYPPPPKPTTTAPAETVSAAPGDEMGGPYSPIVSSEPSGTQPGGHDAELRSAEFSVPDADSEETIALGDDRQNRPGFANPYELAAGITPRGAGVEWLTLTRHRNAVAKDKKHPDHDPYDLLQPVQDPRADRRYTSFVTERVRFRTSKQDPYRAVDLGDALWSIEKTTDADGETATLRTVVQGRDADLLAFEKVYRLAKGRHHLEMSLSVQNLSDQPTEVIVTQRGPVGFPKEDLRSDFRRIVTAKLDDQGVIVLEKTLMRNQLVKEDDIGRKFLPGEGEHTTWAAVANKFFACIVVPRPLEGAENPDAVVYPEYLGEVTGVLCLDDAAAGDDLTFDLALHPPRDIPPGESLVMEFDAFCGPKSEGLFEAIPEAVNRNYHLIRSADSRWCTFQWLTAVMLWLLTNVYKLVGNYGIAIIILVIIVRTILHPVTKRGQINMMKMQKGMGKLKPKLEAIQQQYKNDKQRLQEAQMKLYREEGVNPAGQIFGCLPMVLQMPVWVALWTTLNTNVDMRHESFFWWINDLSSPDTLIPFSGEYHIPLLGAMMGPITSLNLLPIIMTATMYAQQKLTQKLTKPTTPVQPKTDEHGKALPDQMAQQQKLMGFMMFFFGFLFYNFPSGLNLYILSSNLLGMLEQFRIRKHIREKDERGEFEIKRKTAGAVGKPSLLARTFEHMQKKADQARLAPSARPQDRREKKRKKARS